MDYAPCPQCGTSQAAALNFTWWGGALGPRLLSHVKCQDCGKTYNGKTGKDNTTGIVVYFVIVGIASFVLVGIVFVLFFLSR
jgi:hypothetical protein